MKKKRNMRKGKKIRNLVAICSFCAILLSVSTYAWFIGMKTVSVNKFDVEIATTEGLFLSMNGKDWSYQLDAKNAEPYDKNANQWLSEEPNGAGLIPMSSIGDMDKTSSRMKLYQKGSLTAIESGAGYRLMSKQVDNHSKQVLEGKEYIEGDGYIAFDLFVMNLSGDEYYEDNNPLNEEAIYLTTNSAVTVGTGGKENTGIENSIRVGFAQIGRVSAELDLNDRENSNVTSQPIITGIDCTGTATKFEEFGSDKNQYVTGICRDAQIWEPNDTAHTENAIKWYNKGCKARKALGEDVTKAGSYEGVCETVANSTYSPTYAVSRTIDYSDNVNTYDGLKYNKYIKNTTAYSDYLAAKTSTESPFAPEKYKLVEFDYFTDTEKNEKGVARDPFMTLAPNSITKIRVYVWLEGQDVDNYDYAQLGKKVKINFGFTKERFESTDISTPENQYDGPSTKIKSVPYKATGVVTLSQDAINAGVTYDANLKIFTTPADVNSFTFNDGETVKTATYQESTNTWSVA